MGKTYVVKPNDTLSGIAKQQLGRADRWTEIAKTNRIADAHRLLIGQHLVMPADAVTQTPHMAPIRITMRQSALMNPQDRPATTLPARAFFFVVADEFNPFARKAVRRVLSPGENVADAQLLQKILHPEHHGFSPLDPLSPVPMGRHVGGRTDSRFISASDRPLGSPRFDGKRYWIDVAKAERAGAKVHETAEIIADFDRVIAKTKNPVQRAKFLDTKEMAINIDREILFEGHVPASAVKTGGMMAMTRGAQIVGGVGIVLTAYDLEQAGVRSYQQHSVKPLAAESVRQAGGWAAGWAGAELGGMAGAALGIETGPGAIVTGLIGGVIGGVAGFMGADWVARRIEN